MFISLIVPVYNEEKRLPLILEAAILYFPTVFYDYEIIIVNDGSTDNTIGVVHNYKSRLSKLEIISLEKNQGKGFAVKKGMSVAKGDFCVFADADNSTPLEELDKLLTQFMAGYEVVIGSRSIIGSQIKIKQPLYKNFLGRMGSKVIQFLFYLNITDTQAGFKGFSKKAKQLIFSQQKTVGWEFDVEILLLAKKFSLKIKEVPLRWTNVKGSKVKLKDYLKVFFNIFKLKINYIKIK